MRSCYSIILLLFIALPGWGQTASHSLFRGQSSLLNHTTNNKHNFSRYMDQPEVDLSEYGGAVSLGIAFGGSGLVGIPVRWYIKEHWALEMGLYYSPYMVFHYNSSTNKIEEVDYYSRATLDLGGIFYARKKHFNDRVKMDGIAVKLGHTFGVIDDTRASIAWARERIKDKKKDRSLSIELGIGVMYMHENDLVNVFGLTNTNISPFLQFKLHWSWYLKPFKYNPNNMKGTFQ